MFIRSDGTETEFIDMARSFQDYEEALSFTRRNKLQNVELVVQPGSPADEFTLQLPGASNLGHWEEVS